MPDERILGALRRGAPEGIEALWAERGPRLKRLCRSLTGDEQQADAAVADLFLAIYDAALGANFQPDFETWLWTTALGAARRIVPREPSPAHGDESAHADAVLATLPPAERLALALHDVQGLEPALTARLLGESAEAAGIRIERARRAFLDRWESTRRAREPNR
jgi:DNA-directed RNA polymerase specialized sigma24 family protein